MFGRRAVQGDDGQPAKRARRGRGLGPFSGGQLTIIIVTFAVLLLFPIGAWALSFSNVAITDPGGVNQAKVDSGKNLHTAIAGAAGLNVAAVDAKSNLNTAIHDMGTGTAAKVNGFGQVSAAVTGSVTATAAAPSATFVASGSALNGSPSCAFFTPKAGSAAVITHIDFLSKGATSAFDGVVGVDAATASGCTGETLIGEAEFSNASTYSEDLGAGIAVANGHFLDVGASGPSGGSGGVLIHGYYVPAAQCSSGCL
jgi:hypothetical protein